jgi:thiol-disulfide isomerase/thioredoxin
MSIRDDHSNGLLNRPLLRGAIAAAVLVGALVVVLVLRRDGDPDAGEAIDDAATVPYFATVYTLCDDDLDVELAATGPPVIGEPAPDFALCDADGKLATRLSDMKGKVVWLNFWATWCVPCKRELPDIQALYDEKQAEGLEVLIINYRETEARALRFLPDLGIEMPVVIDRPGTIYDRYRLTGLPDSFFIDREGNVAALYYGFINDEIARGRLAAAGLP